MHAYTYTRTPTHPHTHPHPLHPPIFTQFHPPHTHTPHTHPQIESYTYLTHEDDVVNKGQGSGKGELSRFWGPNTALGWAVENIGDLDGAWMDGWMDGWIMLVD